MAHVEHKAGQIITVDVNTLQHKNQASYYLETIKLAKGETYISDIDLNKEKKGITLPPTPILRASIPIYDLSPEIYRK